MSTTTATPVTPPSPPSARAPAAATAKATQFRPGDKPLGFDASSDLPVQAMELEDYARQVIGSEDLWRALIEAIGATITGQSGAYWVVLVDNTVMALAGAAAIGRHLGRTIQVPMLASENGAPSPETLSTELRRLGPNESLDKWVAAAGALPKVIQQESCLLVRGWGIAPTQLAAALGDTFGSDRPAPGAALIALVHGADSESAAPFERGAVLNLTIRQDLVVARTIHALGLPHHQPVASVERAAELVQRLLTANEFNEDAILQALNTPEHVSFERFVWRLDLTQHPETSDLFNRTVLAAAEDHPRHAAALFLVSHFDRIPAGQLIEMGDMLARQTPAARPPADAALQPGEITDRVLEDCGIKISATREKGAYAFFASKESDSREEPLHRAETIRLLFERDAALLKERYLRTLAQAVTIGHPSAEIAHGYEALELSEIRHAAALDITMARERLVRVAFGHPALTGERAAGNHELRSIVENMERLILRMPAFIARVAEKVTVLPPDEVLGALCNALPATLDDDRRTWFRRWAVEIFWGSYAREINGLTLLGYPALFESSSEGRLRRYALVEMLRNALDDPATDFPSQALRSGPLLGRLLADIGKQFERIVQTDGLEIAFLADVAASFLDRMLWRRPWRDLYIGFGAADLSLAHAFLEPRTQSWITNPRPRLAGMEPERRREEIPRLYRICCAVIEALVGSASFDELEDVAISVWLMDAINFAATVENFTSGFFRNGLVWEQAMQEPPDEPDEAEEAAACFYPIIQKLIGLLPLFVLMAATRSGASPDGAPVFTFSEPLRQWLLEPGPLLATSPSKQLMTMLETAHRLQTAWRDAHENWRISVAAPGQVVKALKERADALRAFERILRPCLEGSVRRTPSVRAQSGGASAAPNPSPGTTGSETTV